MNQLTIIYTDGKKEIIKDVDHFDWVVDYMVILFSDMKTRRVISIGKIDTYKYTQQPVLKKGKK